MTIKVKKSSDSSRFVPPSGVQASYREGLKEIERGNKGSGLESQTVAQARRFAKGGRCSSEWARKGNRFWSRNERFLKQAKGTPGYTSALLWGGSGGPAWFRGMVAELDSGKSTKGIRVVSKHGNHDQSSHGNWSKTGTDDKYESEETLIKPPETSKIKKIGKTVLNTIGLVGLLASPALVPIAMEALVGLSAKNAAKIVNNLEGMYDKWQDYKRGTSKPETDLGDLLMLGLSEGFDAGLKPDRKTFDRFWESRGPFPPPGWKSKNQSSNEKFRMEEFIYSNKEFVWSLFDFLDKNIDPAATDTSAEASRVAALISPESGGSRVAIAGKSGKAEKSVKIVIKHGKHNQADHGNWSETGTDSKYERNTRRSGLSQRESSVRKPRTRREEVLGNFGRMLVGGTAAASGAALGTALAPGAGTLVGALGSYGLGRYAGGKLGEAVGSILGGDTFSENEILRYTRELQEAREEDKRDERREKIESDLRKGNVSSLAKEVNEHGLPIDDAADYMFDLNSDNPQKKADMEADFMRQVGYPEKEVESMYDDYNLFGENVAYKPPKRKKK